MRVGDCREEGTPVSMRWGTGLCRQAGPGKVSTVLAAGQMPFFVLLLL